MDELFSLIDELPPEKRALLASLLLRSTGGAPSAPVRDPIAIIGIGCRFPGDAKSPEAFWQLLCAGRDAVTEIPRDRWDVDAFYDPDPNTRGKMCTRWGGFLGEVDKFDPHFFGITPREAVSMDPQQRLLLEVAWEALEDAGHRVERLSGSRTGVYIGISLGDYMRLLGSDEPDNLRRYDIYVATGNPLCIAANRISYLWNLRGPSMAVDTACSSSLVAVHLACQSLWTGESTLALAGGVNMMLLPSTTVLLNKFMSPDGRCKAFDARANGFVRGEGAGVIVLKPLSRAVADGDPIYAIIRGSAINQDGYSSGLTVPNGVAQQALLRDALASAGVEASRVSYVEAHGTGTSLGDPVEANALGAVLGPGRAASDRCAIGSVKSNLGHLEAAAGIAGLIKVALALKHRQLPQSLHFEVPNPNIPFDALSLRVQKTLSPWEPGSGPRLAGVSSFGFGGTNAHVILEEAPPLPAVPERDPAQPGGSPYLLPLSARSPDALLSLARSYRDLLGAAKPDPAELYDICYTACARRDHHDQRLALVGRSPEELTDALSAFLDGETRAGMSSGTRAPGPARRIVFVCSGQGPQKPGMAREIIGEERVFREALEHCDALLYPLAGFSLLDELRADEARSRLDQTEVAQPVLFALQFALAALWRSWGITPDALIGHSVGEIAAAHLAGGLTLEDAVHVAFHRGRLMQQMTGLGTMLAVGLPEADAKRLVAGSGGRLWLGAINSPSSTVLSGERAALEAAHQTLTSQGVPCRPLGVNYAFHSAQMDPLRTPLVEAIRTITPAPISIPVFSTTTGMPMGNKAFDTDYWARNLRQPVLFAAAVDHALQQEYDLFLELGPHPVLSKAISECLSHMGREGAVLPSLRQGRPERATLLESLGALYSMGHPVAWEHLFAAPGRCARLPSYPWQRQRFWMDIAEKKQPEPSGKTIPSAYYDAVAAVSEDALSPVYEENYQIFAPFPEIVPGFSWLVMYTRPRSRPAHFEIMLNAQKEMKAALFRHVEFSSCARVLDFGCGFATDLIALAEAHPHLKLCGYSISAGQLDVGIKKMLARKLEDRITLARRDSSKDEFPGMFDLAIGFEVAHHIKDKPRLFSNLGRHLNDGALLTLADFISNDGVAIEHDETSSYFVTRDEWVDLLSQNQLGVIDCVDVSQEISNFLYDDRFEEALETVYRRMPDENIRSAARSYNQLGKLLRKGLASYVLLTAKKQDKLTKAELIAKNRERLGRLIPYDEVAGNRWSYETVWKPAARAERSKASLETHGDWLLFADAGAVARRLAERMSRRGERCVLVHPGADYQRMPDGRFTIHPGNPSHFSRLVTDAFGAVGPRCPGVVHLWSLDAGSSTQGEGGVPTQGEPLSCGSALYLTQALAKAGWAKPPRLWLVTRGAQPAGARRELALEQASIWGLGRVVAQEHRDLWGGLVDLDPSPSPGEADMLLEELSTPDGEDLIAFRGAERHVARLARIKGQELSHRPMQLCEDGTYLVTGGLGGLGVHVARWMVRRGAGQIVLIGRSGPSPRVREAVARLEAEGARIVIARADVSRESELRALLEEIQRSMPPLRGIVHAAGVLDDGVLLEQDWSRFSRVMAPKVDGAWNLHSLTLSASLDFFVLFSAGVSVLGAAGQSNYVAANTFLDALSHHRRALGLPALSINWGLWAHTGMAASLSEREKRRWEERGAGLIPPEQGVELMERLIQTPLAQAGVMPIHWSKLAESHPAGDAPPLLSDLIEEARRRSEGRPRIEGQVSLVNRLKEVYPSERRELLSAHVESHVRKILGLDKNFSLDPRKPLLDLGMDSLMAVELRNALGRSVGRALPATLLFDHPTIGALVTYLARDILALESARAPEQEPTRDEARIDAALLARIEQLSETEAEALLAERLLTQGD